MAKKKKAEKPPRGYRVQPEIADRFDLWLAEIEHEVPGGVTKSALVGAAFAALMELPKERRNELIWAAKRYDESEFRDHPWVQRLRAILGKEPPPGGAPRKKDPGDR